MSYPSRVLNKYMGTGAFLKARRVIVVRCESTYGPFLKGKVYKYLDGHSKYDRIDFGDFSYLKKELDELIFNGYLRRIDCETLFIP